VTGELDVVTGAFDFTGRYLARRLLALGRRVNTLTAHPDREHSFGREIRATGFDFDAPAILEGHLSGATTLYNTYWIRFERGPATYALVLEQTRVLLQAAAQAGIRRIVHFSSIGADPAADLPFFRAKGEAERLVRDSGLDWTIIRPTLLFGGDGTLFNNLAWMLRRFPAFPVCGRGDYPVQPVHVDDVAELAIDAAHRGGNRLLDAAGVETYAYADLVTRIARATGSRVRLLQVRKDRLLQMTRIVGGLVNDVVLTPDEIEALTGGRMVSAATPAGHTTFSDWVQKHGPHLGVRYRSELERHFN
jgi:NADH dehydrogenase